MTGPCSPVVASAAIVRRSVLPVRSETQLSGTQNLRRPADQGGLTGPDQLSMLQRCMIHGRGGLKLATRLYSTHTLVRSGKVTTATLAKLYRQTTPISVVTAHDYPSALAANKANIDVILVGDSLAMVACGYDDTTQLSMEELLFHCRSVKRGAKNAFLVGDLPFGSFEVSPEQAMRSAIRLVQEGGMEAVKLEGGCEMAETVRKITRHGISVMGHVGLLPQRQASLGGFKVQGKTAEGAEAVLQDALALQDAGCMSIVLEAIPAPVAEIITQRLRIPTIGIGAGAACSGQVLVQMDMLGVFDRFVPRFCKQYDQLGGRTIEAITRYNGEVKARQFPAEEHTYPADSPALAAWVAKNKAS